jgi:peptidoglycan hydrolase-like protein with peptidoglycan-binding domain
MEGPAVERLQERMQALGFYYGEVDGIFGLATEDAVRALQRNFAIDPDGVVGPVTWTVLLR